MRPSFASVHVVAIASIVLTASTFARAADDAAQTAPKSEAAPPSGPAPTEDAGLDSLVDDVFAGRWLDPQDPYWAPRRGERWEVSALLGGEAAGAALSPDKLPTIGGVVLNALGRYYPTDRLAVVFGARTYLGLDGVPAAGTTASSVISAITGIRYDLVREGRFSLLWDLYSGPSIYLFADLPTTDISEVAIGGEMGSAAAMRYSIGPFTGELRGLVGGRAGASSSPFQRADDAGPFSAVYAGVDLGLTWSLQ